MLASQARRDVGATAHPSLFKARFRGFRDHSVRRAHSTVHYRPDVVEQTRFDLSYLISCGREWHGNGDPAAGWELVRAMRSGDRGARAVAAEVLSGTQDGRLLVRDLRRTRKGLCELVVSCKAQAGAGLESQSGALSMKTPYGLEMVEDCNRCRLKKDGWYCALSETTTHGLSEFSHVTTYPGGAILFVEGQTPRGMFVVCSGKVKLSTTSKEGKVLIFKIAEPGEVIGISSAISGDPYQVTAETVGPCMVNFVEREGLLGLMGRSGELGLRSALAASRDFQSACRDIHDLFLTRSASGKLARLLLTWANRDTPLNQGVRIHTPATHEEMAQRIGASRETVTRLLSDLRKRDLIRVEGATLVIKNRTALESMAV